VNLQPVHLVGVSVNIIWVTPQGPCGEHVHQQWPTWDVCKTTKAYVEKRVIKPSIFSPVSRQPALTWRVFFTQ